MSALAPGFVGLTVVGLPSTPATLGPFGVCIVLTYIAVTALNDYIILSYFS